MPLLWFFFFCMCVWVRQNRARETISDWLVQMILAVLECMSCPWLSGTWPWGNLGQGNVDLNKGGGWGWGLRVG